MLCLVIADIHANLAAFEAVLDHAGKFDQIWCLGDIIGYGPDPNECIATLAGFDHRCVAGNHECAALGCQNLREFNRDARRAMFWTRSQLTTENRTYLEGLPARLSEHAFTLVHGSPRQPVDEYIIWDVTARNNFQHFDTQYCLVGHTHAPRIFRLVAEASREVCRGSHPGTGEWEPLGRDRLIINPGSVGQPRDGKPEASYALLDTGSSTIEFRRVPYAVERTQERMRGARLPESLIKRLSSAS